jgi:hypothetical protein
MDRRRCPTTSATAALNAGSDAFTVGLLTTTVTASTALAAEPELIA